MRFPAALRPLAPLALALAVAAHVSALSAAPKEKPAAGAVFDFAKPPAEQTAAFVEVTRGANLKKIKKLAVVNFTVEFVSAKSAAVATRGGFKSSGVVLPALDTAAAQAIADRLYDQLVADLQAAGIELVPFATLRASKEYAKLQGAQHASPWLLENASRRSVFVGARGLPIYVDNPERLEGWNAVGATFGTNTRLHEVMLCNEFNANLLSVNFVVDFADLKTGRFFTNIETSFTHTLAAKHTRFRFAALGQPDFALVSLGRRLDSDQTPFVEGAPGEEQRTTSPDGAVTERNRTTSVTFQPARYLVNTETMLRATEAMFLTAFAQQRGGPVPATATAPLR